MAKIKPWIAVLGALVLAGCAGAPVTRGTLIGAAAGAALGAGTGVLVSSESLLGSSTSEVSGNIGLKKGSTVGAGALIGVVFGAFVGAMIGHGYSDPDAEELPPADAQAQAQRIQPAAF
jgi:hypothetical protein